MLSRPVKVFLGALGALGTLGTLAFVIGTVITIRKRRKRCKWRKWGTRLPQMCRRDPTSEGCATQRSGLGIEERQESEYWSHGDGDLADTRSDTAEADSNYSETISNLPSTSGTGHEIEELVAHNLARTRCARCGQFGHKCSDCENPPVPIGRDWGRTCRRMAFILRRKEGIPIECERKSGGTNEKELEVIL